MAEHEDYIVNDIHGRQWELVSSSGTAKNVWDAPGSHFDASDAEVGDYLIVPMEPGSITFKRIA